ncbi:type I glyceraldehyde-3-phosphate dehydrogenase [Candidatus Wirthbacteria bacterium CG2_30_54_11]|uniref:Glyceraldehyde-3-phosphate dehydrogenase n=1 Tax=Candidatus Wirthbacteria bacterium CG2_30_54_11 TaxID=1817892 RepID=A0A1J5J1Z1_9BACT|nr:MAG: type I glyceraldehyde-3-phosphate dehydrogenase [Candidatus Wirthbacteria bacterium CG2_30_54_11]
MPTARLGINGFGRIGRQIARIVFEQNRDIEIVGVNDLMKPSVLAHLFKYDSNFGIFNGTVEAKETSIVINGHEIPVLAEKDPAVLPWGKLGAEYVIESTGLFVDKEGATKHITAGAKKVLISAPAKDEDITIVLGVNQEKYDPATHHIISNASCTTNCLAPIAKVINDKFTIKKGSMTTVHSYTMDQKLQDAPHKDLRRSRSACQSIIPTTTGAAKALGLVIPSLKGKIDGFSLRVPTSTVSIVDLVALVEEPTTREEVNQALRDAAASGSLKGYLDTSDEPLVSIDYKGNCFSSIADLMSTMVIDGNLVKAVSWYDNEWGYSNRMVDLVEYVHSFEK